MNFIFAIAILLRLAKYQPKSVRASRISAIFTSYRVNSANAVMSRIFCSAIQKFYRFQTEGLVYWPFIM